MIQKGEFAIVDTHVPAISTPRCIEVHPHRSRILPVGYHQEGCPSLLPGLHHITLTSNRRGMFRNKRGTSAVGELPFRWEHRL